MAVTAQAQSALTLEPSTTWALCPGPARRRRGRPWAAIGLVGAGMVAAAIATVTITVGSSAVSRDSVQADTSVDATRATRAVRVGRASIVSEMLKPVPFVRGEGAGSG